MATLTRQHFESAADVIEHLLAREDLTDKERAYLLFVTGDANCRTSIYKMED